jgi:hypothetical protein
LKKQGIIMPNRPVFALLIMTLLGFPVALLAQQVVQTEKFNYPLTSGGKFTIDDANGTVAIRCWDHDEVEITATKHAESKADLDAIRIDIKQGTGTIEVHTIYPSPGPHNGGVSYQVVLPKDLGNVDAITANGSISAESVSGSVSIKSENGAIIATSLKGPFSLSTTNGSINADCTDLAGDGILHTTNGSITLENRTYEELGKQLGLDPVALKERPRTSEPTQPMSPKITMKRSDWPWRQLMRLSAPVHLRTPMRSGPLNWLAGLRRSGLTMPRPKPSCACAQV